VGVFAIAITPTPLTSLRSVSDPPHKGEGKRPHYILSQASVRLGQPALALA
jgi:hypothetical protein